MEAQESMEIGDLEDVLKLDMTLREFQEVEDETSDGSDTEDTPPFNIDYEMQWFTENISISNEIKEIISKCQDKTLKEAMMLNQIKAIYLKQQLTELREQLAECRKQKAAFRHRIEKLSQTKPSTSIENKCCYVTRLAIPYFRDKQGFPCPRNSDWRLKKTNASLVFVDLPPAITWGPYERSCLDRAAKQGLRMTAVYNVRRQLAIAKSDEEIESLEDKMDKIRIASYTELAREWEDKLDWGKISVNMKTQQSENECKAFWKLYMSPLVNKSSWKSDEISRLQKLVDKYKMQNWEGIAEELNTGRTGYQCCIVYFSKLFVRFNQRRWSDEEDQELLDAVEFCRIGNFIPWDRICNYVKNRSRVQLYHRYKYALQPLLRKGHFSIAEDACLIVLRERLSNDPTFSSVARRFPGRTSIQLRNRYVYISETNNESGCFTTEIDKQILDHVKQYGERKWTVLGKATNRNCHHLRHRYTVLKKFLKANPEAKIEEVHRRTRKDKVQKSKNRQDELNRAIEKARELSTDELTVENIKDLIGDNKRTVVRKKRVVEVEQVEEELMRLFETTYRCSGRPIRPTPESVVEAAKVIQTLLDCAQCEDFKDAVEIDAGRIDQVDPEILAQLPEPEKDCNTKLVFPPSLWSLAAMRSLLLKHKELYEQAKLVRRTDVDKLKGADVFKWRFEKLFRWPAMMTMSEFTSSAVLQIPSVSSTLSSSNELNVNVTVSGTNINVTTTPQSLKEESVEPPAKKLSVETPDVPKKKTGRPRKEVKLKKMKGIIKFREELKQKKQQE